VKAGFRHDIQTMRVLAIALIVGYHFWPEQVPGGYVGVDAFLAVSGFLFGMSRRPKPPSEKPGPLAAFWANRARRVLPAAFLVLLATTIGVLFLAPAPAKRQWLIESVTSAFFAQNWELAAQSVDYLALTNDPSPLQHYWFISAQEQAIALFAVLIWLVGRFRSRRPVIATVALISAGSLAYGIYLTPISESAYFSTFTRVWELGIGVLIGLLWPQQRVESAKLRPVAQVLATLGVAAIVATGFLYTDETPFPGWMALVPVVGAALVVGLGESTWLAKVGAIRPVAFLARISYAIYLWHFPLQTLLSKAALRPLSDLEKALVIVLTLALAWLTTAWVEDRLRFGWLANRRPIFIGVCGVLSLVLVLEVPVIALIQDRSVRVAQAAELRALEKRLAADPSAECLGARTVQDCSYTGDETNFMPSPAIAASDRTVTCGGSRRNRPESCQIIAKGKKKRKHLALLGDSHAASWAPGLETWAKANKYSLTDFTQPDCQFVTRGLITRNVDHHNNCEEKIESALAEFNQDEYDAIIFTSMARGIDPKGKSYLEGVAAKQELFQALLDAGEQVVVIKDYPVGYYQEIKDPNECLSTRTPDQCRMDRELAFPLDPNVVAAQALGIPVVDLTDLACPDDGSGTCPVVQGGINMFAEQDHLTNAYVYTLGPYLGQRINEALGWD
jgi:peptidoglycan/LPS O-acetylase OafA/YrhL